MAIQVRPVFGKVARIALLLSSALALAACDSSREEELAKQLAEAKATAAEEAAARKAAERDAAALRAKARDAALADFYAGESGPDEEPPEAPEEAPAANSGSASLPDGPTGGAPAPFADAPIAGLPAAGG